MKQKNSFLRVLVGMLKSLVLYQIAIRIVRKLWHFPAPAFIGRFLDSDLRRKMQPPGPIIEQSGIRPGIKVLEIGCGSGGYTTFVARAVGPEGEICALDIQPEMLEQLAYKLAQPEYSDITNVTLYEQSAYDLPFDDGTFDVVYMVTVLFEIPDRQRALAEVKRVLKPDGKFSSSEFLFDPDYPLLITTIKAAQSAGFRVDHVGGSFWAYTARFGTA